MGTSSKLHIWHRVVAVIAGPLLIMLLAGCGQDPAPGGQPTTAPGTGVITNVKVTFVPNIVITGYSMDKQGSSASSTICRHVTATIVPAAETPNVSFDIDNSGAGTVRAVMRNLQANAQTGIVEFDVFGRSMTPADKPNGDVRIVARRNNIPIGDKAPVIVEIPSQIGTPHQTPEPKTYGVIAENVCLTANTSPAAPNVPAGQFLKARTYGAIMTITVWNQFKRPLDSVYDGQAVYEETTNINRPLSGGRYSDPVGQMTVYGYAEDTMLNRYNWQTAVVPQRAEGVSEPLDFDHTIVIAGHTLNPSIRNRRGVLTTAANGATSLKVTWPNN